jgi:vacuolar-type H+-ATPase subunit C/Vma6
MPITITLDDDEIKLIATAILGETVSLGKTANKDLAKGKDITVVLKKANSYVDLLHKLRDAMKDANKKGG